MTDEDKQPIMTDVDKRLDDLSEAFARGVSEVSQHPVLRKGILEAAVCDVAWSLDHHFPGDRHLLADFFRDMAEVLANEPADKTATVPDEHIPETRQ